MPGGLAQRLSAALVRSWVRRGPLALLLWPLSMVYGALALIHRTLYAWGLLHAEKLPVPVVVVGNVVAGGGGKTPVVLALAEHLQARGIAVGIVSRGYGRRPGNDAPLAVTAQTDVAQAG